jgi:hypothetical protein
VTWFDSTAEPYVSCICRTRRGATTRSNSSMRIRTIFTTPARGRWGLKSRPMRSSRQGGRASCRRT